jgi:hypothetical protein
MITYIIYGENEGLRTETLKSILKQGSNLRTITVDKFDDLEFFNIILNTKTTYCMILKAGDIVEFCRPTEYKDITLPNEIASLHDSDTLRGVLLGEDAIRRAPAESTISLTGFIKYLCNNRLATHSDFLRIKFIGEKSNDE